MYGNLPAFFDDGLDTVTRVVYEHVNATPNTRSGADLGADVVFAVRDIKGDDVEPRLVDVLDGEVFQLADCRNDSVAPRQRRNDELSSKASRRPYVRIRVRTHAHCVSPDALTRDEPNPLVRWLDHLAFRVVGDLDSKTLCRLRMQFLGLTCAETVV